MFFKVGSGDPWGTDKYIERTNTNIVLLLLYVSHGSLTHGPILDYGCESGSTHIRGALAGIF